jgi:diaminopimelate epimerase
MSGLKSHTFVKMNGLGNEILIVDMRENAHLVTSTEARAMAGAVPFDQLMAIYPPRAGLGDAYVSIFNNDGSEAGACGNGMRCVAEILLRESHRPELIVETRAGVLRCWPGEAALTSTVDMGIPRFLWQDIPLSRECPDTRVIDLGIAPAGRPALHSPSAVSMGNPHAVFWVDDLDGYDLASIGPVLEHDPLFPDRANISLAKVISRTHMAVRTWERGAGLTRACGSAACAAAVAAARLGRTEGRVTITLPGGDLGISWRPDGHVRMTGPVAYEFEGRFDPALFATVDGAP